MKSNYYKMRILVITFSFLTVGCVAYEEPYYTHSHPHVVMKSVISVDSQANEPAKIFVEFENIGEEDAYDLSGMLSLHIGNTIKESENFLIERIAAGRTVIAEIWLTSIDTHNEYEYYSIDFGWYDYWDQYYE